MMLVAALVAALAAGPAAAQAPATDYDGAAALGLSLRRVGATERVLMIGAHPDDENTALLATLALGRGADVAYLSLTRGEGGQNLLGPELQEALGLVRTEELLAARRLDGAGQFFTRAYDFGFSKHAEEAFQHWPRDSLLADVVAAIRAFRPDIVVSVFSGTPRDGHGQHQAAGIMAREAFEVAGDPDRFPDQLVRGLRPHRPRKLYQSLWYRTGEGGLEVATGRLDPLFGRSHYQIAMASRSRHRSQDMGRPQPPGPRSTTLRLVARRTEDGSFAYAAAPDTAGAADAADALFAGVDTTLSGRARRLGADAGVVNLLAAYDSIAFGVRRRNNALDPAPLVPHLGRAIRLLQQAASALGTTSPELRFHIAREAEDARNALVRAAGVELDAVAADEYVVPGQTFELELTLWNGGRRPVAVRALAPDLPHGWRAEPLDSLPAGPVLPGQLLTRRFRVRVPEAAEVSEPYYLRRSRSGDMYVWSGNPDVDGRPFAPAPVWAEARVNIIGAAFRMETEATFRRVDKALGEVRRPVQVVPAVSVALEPGIGVLPLSGPRRELDFTVRLRSEAPGGVTGTVRLELPAGWRAEPAAVPVAFEEAGESRVVEFTVRTPTSPEAGAHTVRAVFEAADERYTRGYQVVDYPHIRPRLLFRPAAATVRTVDVTVPRGLTVAYVEGAGDDAPRAMAQLGLDVDLLEAEDLASGDLDRYDVIVTGIRAYEVRDDLVAHNRRLLEYVRRGGTLIVQYNKYEFDEGDYAPYPLTMARPHDRVTDEAAPVTLLEPDHPVLSWPNRITARDFEGWVQDRGLYFAHTWDERYTPLLEMHDPGDPPLRGGLLVARHGEGTYVYTGLAFFRQFPAGVPGAYRLFANLLALGRSAP